LINLSSINFTTSIHQTSSQHSIPFDLDLNLDLAARFGENPFPCVLLPPLEMGSPEDLAEINGVGIETLEFFD
jgi:hypothetical protein